MRLYIERTDQVTITGRVMAVGTSIDDILSSFTSATESALQTLPDIEASITPRNGISLLDTKNEIFLSYLQALALRNLSVVRSLKNNASVEETQQLSNNLTDKLVEYRVYLERGVKPLEQKIKYQVDKAVKTADDEARAQVQRKQAVEAKNGQRANDGEGSRDSDEDDEDSDTSGEAELDAASFRPKLGESAPLDREASERGERSRGDINGVYRPPRVSATSMPTTETRERKERRPGRSATLEEYVSTELSNAPLAEPSIGSTIAAGGRRNKDARQLAKEQERREYEETNLVRLPAESKKERGKQAGRDRGGGFGGDEFRGLGQSADRIGDLTRRKSRDNVVERSRKRAVEDGPRNDGVGDAFDVKKRRLAKKMSRR